MKTDTKEKILREKVHNALCKSAQEILKNPVSVGVGSVNQVLVNNHNFRLIYDFLMPEELRQKIKLYIKTDPNLLQKGSGDTTFKLINHQSTIQVIGFHDCNIQIKKETIELRYLPKSERWHLYSVDEKGSQAYLKDILKSKIYCDLVLTQFIKEYGGSSKKHIKNIYLHSKAMGDKTINRIPRKLKFGNNIVQKEYNIKEIEYTSPAAMANYLTNQGISEQLPTIDKAINDLSTNILFTHPFQTLKIYTSSPHEVINNPDFLKLMRLLTEQEREQLWCYWHECVDDGIIDGCTGARLKGWSQ